MGMSPPMLAFPMTPAPASSQPQASADTPKSARTPPTPMVLSSVFVMAPDPERSAAALVAALGDDVEVLVVEVERLDAARESRVGAEHAPLRVLREHAHALALRGVGVLQLEVVERLLLLH